MTTVLFVEGGARGAHSKESRARCREAFRKILEGLGFNLRKLGLSVVACGPRSETIKDFETEILNAPRSQALLLVDSEKPVADICKPLDHLKNNAGWSPAADLRVTDDLIFLMTTSMETWITADPANLKRSYSRVFVESALPSLHEIERKNPTEILAALKRATSGKYEKGDVSFKLLACVDVDQLRRLPSFKRIEKKLRKRFFGS